MSILYFGWKHADAIHDEIIRVSGGLPGHKDMGILDSVLFHIQNDEYYPTFEEKLTHLIFGVAKYAHAFNDGNKRTSIALGAYFLEINRYDYCIKYFMQEMENITVLLVENKVSKELLLKIITSLINEPDFEESLKMEIIHSIG